jgi:hypothetical protein
MDSLMEAARFCSVCKAQINRGPASAGRIGSVCFSCAGVKLRRVLLGSIGVVLIAIAAIAGDRRFRHHVEVTFIGAPIPLANASSGVVRDHEIGNSASPVTKNSANAAAASSSGVKAAIIKPPGVPFGICGAPTKSGKFCQRKVKDGGYCWQHRYLLKNPA